MANIEFHNVSKSFGNNKVINNFNLKGEEDEFLVLVGPSGCGKSTLLRMIAGLENIDEGIIKINDETINETHPSKRHTAMVFQSYALYPHMNVYENMSFGLKMEKKSKEEIHSKVLDAAKVLKINELLDRRPKELSGGQRQRVAIGRAITRNPKIFLFDEPLSNLDAALRSEMRVEISRLHKKIKTNMIYVTHDQVEAMTLADRIVILNNGNIEQIGNPNEIYSNPENIFVAQFIGTPKMNIFDINYNEIISDNSINFFGNKISFKNIKLEKKKYFLGLRPENLSLSKKNEFELDPKIELIENLGNEKIIHMSQNSREFCAKISGDTEIKNNFGFEFRNILLFEENGKRVKF